MSQQSKATADFDEAVVNHPDTAPPPYTSSSTSATTAPHCTSSSTEVTSKEDTPQYIARMGLFDGQGKNADILSIIIIANLVAANPDTEELTLSKEEVATLSLQSIPFIERLKAGIKEQDPARSDETYGKNPSFASTMGEAEKKRHKDKLEVELRWDNEYEFKGYADFMAIWLPIFGTEEERKEEERNVKMYADWQKCLEQKEQLSKASLNFARMLPEALNEGQNA